MERLDSKSSMHTKQPFLAMFMKDLTRYAMGGSQSDGSLPSEILIYRKVAMSILTQQYFHLLPLNRRDQGTTMADLELVEA